MNQYLEFIKRKETIDRPTGLSVVPALNPMLFAHQSDMVKWALRRGRAALFADCGLGKSPMQLEWADKQPHERLPEGHAAGQTAAQAQPSGGQALPAIADPQNDSVCIEGAIDVTHSDDQT